ncbi:MAG: hypothetical protein JJU29_22405 [Verrucomicrobia bacterium]|nr:hypothetical protein [Verrucomicrobiota bacterium]MCH8513179.1 hypothetical protein [Kiritimatiellia bacterium]
MDTPEILPTPDPQANDLTPLLAFLRDVIRPAMASVSDRDEVLAYLRQSKLTELAPVSAEGVWKLFREEAWQVWDKVVTPCLAEVLVEILSMREDPEPFLLDIVCDVKLRTPTRERAAVGLASRGDVQWVDRLVEVLTIPDKPFPMVFTAVIAVLAQREEAKVDVWLMRLLSPVGCHRFLREDIDRAQLLAQLIRRDAGLLPEFLMKHAPQGTLRENERQLLRKCAAQQSWLAPLIEHGGGGGGAEVPPLMRVLEYGAEALGLWALREIVETLPAETAISLLLEVMAPMVERPVYKHFTPALCERATQFALELASLHPDTLTERVDLLPDDDPGRLRLVWLMHEAGMTLDPALVRQSALQLPELADLPASLALAILRRIPEIRCPKTEPRWLLAGALSQAKGEPKPRADFGLWLIRLLQEQEDPLRQVTLLPGVPNSRVFYVFDRLLFLGRHEVWISPFGPFVTPAPGDMAEHTAPLPPALEARLRRVVEAMEGIWIEPQTIRRELKGCPLWNYASTGKHHDMLMLLFPTAPP